MSRILVFAAGALFGGACVFYFFDLKRPEPPTAQLAACPPLPAAVASPQNCMTPPPPVVSVPPTETPVVVEPPPTAGEPPAPAIAASAPRPQPGPLLIPVAGIKARQLSDTFTDSRGSGRIHDAIDIMAPTGTPVNAVDDGKVVKLFRSVPGGLTVYQFDPSERFAYYYAHLAAFAPGIVEGTQLKRGDLVGYVGYSGNASPAAPHLHFAIFLLGPEKRWWEGTAINPYPFLTSP